jgi:hypothetical protein
MFVISNFLLAACLLLAAHTSAAEPGLSIAAFHVDVTPPLGAPLCDGRCKPAESIVDPLSARGVVILGAGPPIVLCAFDWVGIGNSGYDYYRQTLAEAAGTTVDRVAVHTLHQHDAPGCDFEAEELLASHNLSGEMFHVPFAREAIARVADAVRFSMQKPTPVTHVGTGRGRVEHVASNRRVMGPNGKVKAVRYSACKDENVRAEPEGTIDPDVKLVAFYNDDRPIVVLTYYATHPQSHYNQGGVSYDFPGMARALREVAMPGIPLVHFNGAGGNVTAGKYNDGAPENRLLLAQRLAEGMRAAWESVERRPVSPSDVEWRTTDVVLPLSPRIEDEAKLLRQLDDPQVKIMERVAAARNIVFARRAKAQHKTTLSCLKLGRAYLVHMPGELFVEYQLAAAGMRPDNFVCMAAYGDYGAGYIGTEASYSEGGYEPTASRVAPSVEAVLMSGLQELLQQPQRPAK